MSYDHLNIGQLLFSLPNAELKQRVRNLERFYKRYISAKTGILFTKTYIYIYISLMYSAFYINNTFINFFYATNFVLRNFVVQQK